MSACDDGTCTHASVLECEAAQNPLWSAPKIPALPSEIRTAHDVVAVLAHSLLTRKGEAIDEELALERAKNAACALIELVDQAARWRKSQRECCHYHRFGGSELNSCGADGPAADLAEG